MSSIFHYHSRHIPLEHLKMTTPNGRSIARNELPDVLDAEHLKNLKRWGIDTVELRLTWWELEKTPGVLDWSRFDRDIERVEKAGLAAGLMAWFHYPPAWFHGTFFRCVTHDFETTTLSPWAPETREIMDRLYRLTAERYGKRIDFVYVMGSGDFGEPVLPQGVDHYLFSSPHSHGGVAWTGDVFARKAWSEISSIPPEEAIYSDDGELALRYVDFITGQTSQYMADCYRIVRKYFPHARYGVPLGHLSEAPCGQNRSEVIRKMAEVSPDFTVRWTGMACMNHFGKSNIHACRISSAARFYGVAFGEEAALILEKENAANALYESIANGCSMLHNDYGNIIRSGESRIADARSLPCDAPETEVALLWPETEESLLAVRQSAGQGDARGFMAAFMEKAAELRKRTNYDICDRRMIQNGFLRKYRTLVVFSEIPPETARFIQEFQNRGGKISDGREFPEDASGLYRTVHTRHISEYNAATGEIRIFPR